MDVVAQIYDLLQKKKDKFSAYELATQEMLHCKADDLGDYIIKRGQLANEIDEICAEIEALCIKEEKGALYAKITYAHARYEEVPETLRPLFELSQQMRSVMARIQKLEPSVVVRLESLKQEAFQKIKENHNLPKIKKYLSSLGNQPSSGHFTSTKV